MLTPQSKNDIKLKINKCCRYWFVSLHSVSVNNCLPADWWR